MSDVPLSPPPGYIYILVPGLNILALITLEQAKKLQESNVSMTPSKRRKGVKKS